MIVFHGLNNQAMKILTCWWVHDSAEVCELVGTFLLNNLSHVIDKTNVGLYRDDGLGVFKSHSGPESERKRKKIIKTFNTYNLSITIETNIRAVNFLDTLFKHLLINRYLRSQFPYTRMSWKRVDFTKNFNMLEKK